MMLTEVVFDGSVYSLEARTLNPATVTGCKPCRVTKRLLAEGKLPAGLDPRLSFTRVLTLDGESVIVVGEVAKVHEKLFGRKSRLLLG